jgi:hypothetical protein
VQDSLSPSGWSDRAVASSTFAELLIRRTIDFSQERPAYFILRAASVKFSRSSTARQNLRDSLVQAFQGKNPSLSPDNALLIANLVLETVKGFLAAVTTANPKQRSALTIEFIRTLALYLEAKFDRPEYAERGNHTLDSPLMFWSYGRVKKGAEVHPYKAPEPGQLSFR